VAKLQKKTITEKIAEGVDHLLHPNHEEENEASEETDKKEEVSSPSIAKKNDNNEHPKFNKFKKGF
jgi:hypothetical protein